MFIFFRFGLFSATRGFQLNDRWWFGYNCLSLREPGFRCAARFTFTFAILGRTARYNRICNWGNYLRGAMLINIGLNNIIWISLVLDTLSKTRHAESCRPATDWNLRIASDRAVVRNLWSPTASFMLFVGRVHVVSRLFRSCQPQVLHALGNGSFKAILLQYQFKALGRKRMFGAWSDC